jgi:hypothetical protein
MCNSLATECLNVAQKEESAQHSLQQLKAEIAALATEFSDPDKGLSICDVFEDLIDRLRQLSAV